MPKRGACSNESMCLGFPDKDQRFCIYFAFLRFNVSVDCTVCKGNTFAFPSRHMNYSAVLLLCAGLTARLAMMQGIFTASDSPCGFLQVALVTPWLNIHLRIGIEIARHMSTQLIRIRQVIPVYKIQKTIHTFCVDSSRLTDKNNSAARCTSDLENGSSQNENRKKCLR